MRQIGLSCVTKGCIKYIKYIVREISSLYSQIYELQAVDGDVYLNIINIANVS